MIENHIGQRIRVERKAAGLTQEELARAAGFNVARVGLLERGEVSDPHLSTLRGIANALGISLRSLLGEDA